MPRGERLSITTFASFYIDNIAQNQSFVQKGIGVKYKTIVIWFYP